MTIEIEKNIPPPERKHGARGKYPWRELSVGNSFFVPGVTTQTMCAIAAGASRRCGYKFTCRTVDGGVRVWRVE